METLKAIWETYKGDIIPVLITMITVILTGLAYYISSKFKAQGAKEVAQAEVLAQVAAKEDTRPQLDALDAEVNKVKDILVVVKETLVNMTDIFNTAFQSSTLDPEVKEQLNTIAYKIKNGVGDDVIKSLQDELDKYKDLYVAVKTELENSVKQVGEITQSESTRVRN